MMKETKGNARDGLRHATSNAKEKIESSSESRGVKHERRLRVGHSNARKPNHLGKGTLDEKILEWIYSTTVSCSALDWVGA